VLLGDNSVGEFYSVALTNGHMQADTGTKMIHIGKNTKSTIISKGISADYSSNAYRGEVNIHKSATGARNYTQCDSMLVGDKSAAHTFPYITVANASSTTEHEATTSRISEDQLFYFESRGIKREDAIQAMVGGFCKDVFKELPGEFATEARQLLTLKLEHSVG
jgi:Fe-S cluster assembly protein SufB